jgi:YVTN family beta-propeller protein
MHQRALVPIVLLGLAVVPLGARPPLLASDDQDQLHVGVQPDGRIVVPTNQILKPSGKQITFPGRPVDLALAYEGRVLVVKNSDSLLFINTATGVIEQRLTAPLVNRKRVGFSVVGLAVDGNTIYVSDAENHVRVARLGAGGRHEWVKDLPLPVPQADGAAHPAGLALEQKDKLWITSTRGNSIVCLDPETGKTSSLMSVGVAPFTIRFAHPANGSSTPGNSAQGPGLCFVSNWGGDAPGIGDLAGNSSGTAIRIDPRTGVANQGTVSAFLLRGTSWERKATISVGLHPSGLVLSPDERMLYVANANSDTVSVIAVEARKVMETIACRPQARLPFGSGSNALALSPVGGTLYVANGTNNCIAVIRLGRDATHAKIDNVPDKSELAGLIPTGWYPGAIQVSADGKRLFVANIKGHGSVSQPRPVERGKKTKDHLGSVSIIDVPDAKELDAYTAVVNANNRLAYSLAGLEKPRPEAAPQVVPQRHGERSVIKHVLYIIKENRTYDQVFGDMKEGNGDPNLVLFGENVTPNHHALARQFTLFDNFYCSGVLSADGHSWANEAYVTDYLERAFGGFTRSYPDDGSDPLAYPSTGFLWDNALAHKKTLRNYGEFVNQDYAPKQATWTDYYNDYKSGASRIPIAIRSNLKSLQPYTHPHYPWFPLLAPDVYRARVFIEELKEFEKKGTLPNLIYLTLPCDHTDGTRPGFPTPRAMVADNDLALGRIVEAVSKSRFWPETCIFVVEDDPQDGFDHVDAHRTVALAISPYTKRRFVDHTNYNQTGMVKSIELMLGLPPMNQLDLSATPMRYCFQSQPDLTPYQAVPNQIPLDEMNPELDKLRGQALEWARKSLAMNLDEGDEADEDTLNRILWHSVRGDGVPYPEDYFGKESKSQSEGK